LLKSKQLKSIAAVLITVGAPKSDVAALPAEKALSAAFLALGNGLEGNSAKKKQTESGMKEVLSRQPSTKNKPPSANANKQKRGKSDY
jgi:hypothetical protein